ncbi:hypothetical protein F0562_031801 [Nyssa sinensis]|uniref:PPM-type phosphatase domain-containing protein n=1 Tax=Nyssa sinensis TaxID=561372 RepID=A0A5J5AVF8_9ASTE|nr:hypothetical protein F0562_031801 [Nyssa sinensis]
MAEIALNTSQAALSGSMEYGSIGMSTMGGSYIVGEWSRPRDDQGLEDLFTEEIRLRSSEMLENDDMQRLLKTFNMGGVGVGSAFGHSDEACYSHNVPYEHQMDRTYGNRVDKHQAWHLQFSCLGCLHESNCFLLVDSASMAFGDIYQAIATAALQDMRVVDPSKQAPPSLLQFQQPQSVPNRPTGLVAAQMLQQSQPQPAFIQSVQESQSLHPMAEYHGAARAVGGCAIYVKYSQCDKPGQHDFNLLKKLVLPDGDRYLKPWIIPEPEVMFIPRAREDECLILASDGLWDAITNEEACEMARRRILLWHKKNGDSPLIERGQGVDPAAQAAAKYLSMLALQKGSTDNISVIVVDLKSQRKFKSKS